MNTDQYTARWAKGFSSVQKNAADPVMLDRRPKPEGLEAKDLVDPSSFGTGFADMMLPTSIGGERAGKAEVMARAIGRKPSYAVTHPTTHALGSEVAGMGIGLAGGGLAGALLGAIGTLGYGVAQGNPSGDDIARGAGIGGLAGGYLGSLGGAIGGIVHSGRKRSHEIEDISKDFDNAETIRPNYREASPLGVLGFTGSHSRGRTKALQAELGQLDSAPQSTSTIATALAPFTGPASTPLGYASSWNNLHSARRDRQNALKLDARQRPA